MSDEEATEQEKDFDCNVAGEDRSIVQPMVEGERRPRVHDGGRLTKVSRCIELRKEHGDELIELDGVELSVVVWFAFGSSQPFEDLLHVEMLVET